MLDPKLLNEARREHTRRECTTEDVTELRVKTTNTHVLELKVRRENSVRRSPETNGLGPTRLTSATTHFFPLDLSLIALSPALMKFRSVLSMRRPMFEGDPPPPPRF
jgi:hypothetical protein